MTARDLASDARNAMPLKKFLVPLLLVTLAALGGCKSAPTGSLTQIPPPDGWKDALTEWRERKDVQFKTDPQTPLLAEDVPAFDGLE
jgi:hypothetical protein